MGRMYCCDLAPAAATVALDIFELTPADDKPIIIHGFRIYQTSDFGDAQDEIIGVKWVRGNATSGSGGNAAANGVAKIPSDAGSGFTFESGNTTAASTGTPVTVYSTGWNVRAPLEVTFTPEQRIQCTQGQTLLCLRMVGAPADSLTIGASVDVEEIG